MPANAPRSRGVEPFLASGARLRRATITGQVRATAPMPARQFRLHVGIRPSIKPLAGAARPSWRSQPDIFALLDGLLGEDDQKPSPLQILTGLSRLPTSPWLVRPSPLTAWEHHQVLVCRSSDLADTVANVRNGQALFCSKVATRLSSSTVSPPPLRLEDGRHR